jgi:hypothetical protein
MKWIHAAVTVRVINTVSPTLKPEVLETWNELLPDGTYESVMFTEPLVCQVPDP